MRFLIPLLLLFVSLLPAEDQYRDNWISVADHLVGTPAVDYPFNWGEGVQMMGLMKVHQRTWDDKYAAYVGTWFSLISQEAIAEVLEKGEPSIKTRPGYCGHWSPGTAALLLYQKTRDEDHLSIAELVADFIASEAERHPVEQGLAHWSGNHQYWVDTLYMACPLYAGLAKQKRSVDHLVFAANQIIVFANHLQNAESGLFYHMWDWDKDEHTPEFWGRGNGWVLMSLADTLEMSEPLLDTHQPLIEITRKLAAGLEETQDEDGLWHTILDDHATYPEASASMMFTYALLKLVRLGMLPDNYVEPAMRSWKAVNERYVTDGVVTGVSAGTGPSAAKGYKERPLGTYTWGTGAYLMAGSEVDRLK
jgi:unsaturated rhamnogalacturonyl hydrolase